MSDKMDRVLEKLEKIGEDVIDIKIAQAGMSKDIERNTDDLEEHMRRTDLLESHLEPLQKNVQQWIGVGKGLTTVSVLLGIALLLVKLSMIFGIIHE